MDDLENLHKVLVSLNITLGKLLTVEKEKTRVLETGDIDKLNDQINTEQALIMECSAAEKQRELVCERLGIQSMSELYKKYPQSNESIRSAHSELIDNVNSLKKTGIINNKLLDTRLSIIKLMNSQLGICTENTQYGKNAGCAVNRTRNKVGYKKRSIL